LVNAVNSAGIVRSKQEVIHKAKEIEALIAQEELEKSLPAGLIAEAAAPSASVAAPAAAAPEEDDWTNEQQQALEAALKKFKAGTPKRFEEIAPLV
jgi:hypothetical protein